MELDPPLGDRSPEYFPGLVATGTAAYPSDTSDLEDLPDSTLSELHHVELKLMLTLVEFYRKFHGWRMFAETYHDTPLDEFLAVAHPPGDQDHWTGPSYVDPDTCRAVLSQNEDYLDAVGDAMADMAERHNEDTDGENIPPDLDAQAEQYAASKNEEIAEL